MLNRTALKRKAAILIIYTGGTIGMKTDPRSGALVPFDFSNIYDELPALQYLGVDVEVISYDPIDSSNVNPELWTKIAVTLRDTYAKYDGFVVLHGTDTMSYSASALSYMLGNLDKPVVFTGSQIPIGVLRTDGRENLITAIEIASAERDGKPLVPEVGLYFQNRLYRANRTTKFSAEELDAFRSENYPALADVGVNIHYNTQNINYPAEPTRTLEINTRLTTDVAVVRLFPGMTERTLRAMLGIEGLRGVVLETYGSGNAPTSSWFLNALREAVERGVYVINVTQCPSGSVAMEMYDTGIGMREIGVIGGRDITTEAAVTKLMCVLGSCTDHQEIVRKLETSLRGEIG